MEFGISTHKIAAVVAKEVGASSGCGKEISETARMSWEMDGRIGVSGMLDGSRDVSNLTGG